MRSLFCILAFSAVAVSGQRRGRQQQPLNSYGAAPEEAQATYLQADASSLSESVDDHEGGLDWLLKSVPGEPGQDYPIYDKVPETSFTCDGRTPGGYYADPEAECQAFYICVDDALGGLAQYSFLCPNGTIFNQEYFICDWWFNFDCSAAEQLYSLNEDIAAEREAATASQSNNALQGSGSVNTDYVASEAAAAPQSTYGRQGRRRFN